MSAERRHAAHDGLAAHGRIDGAAEPPPSRRTLRPPARRTNYGPAAL